MKILVTGAGGQVGSALCRLGASTLFDVIGLNSGELDISDEIVIKEVLCQIKPDVIVNAAAYTAVDMAEQNSEDAFRVNAYGPEYLARAAAKADIPLLHFSTDYVFDGTKQGAYIETDSTAPLCVYGSSKLRGEQAIQTGCAKHLIFRTSWVFGLEGNNFPKTMLRLAVDRHEIKVVADQLGCPTFADDIAATVFHMLERYQKHQNLPWGLYHYTGSTSCSWYEFACYVLERARAGGVIGTLPCIRGISSSEYPTLAKRPANSRLNCDKFMAAFPGLCLSDCSSGVDKLLKFT